MSTGTTDDAHEHLDTALLIPGSTPDEDWEKRALAEFEQRMLDAEEPFPCIFGVDAVRRGTLRYAFVRRGRHRASDLVAALREYADGCAGLGRRTSLVTFFEHDAEIRGLPAHWAEFWRLLRTVRDADEQPWPAGIDQDTESPTWKFSCFGKSFFVVANTPAHELRRSRHLSHFAITFQPRFVFDGLSADTTAGRNARSIIRERLDRYDRVAPHSGLGDFGEPGNREWLQYFLPDTDRGIPAEQRCPLSARTEGTTMTGPAITDSEGLPLPGELESLLPDQGAVELQHDGPGKTFSWHEHSVDERLSVIRGELTLFWHDPATGYHERRCSPGAVIALPAGTVHGSTAGPGGAYYVIRPMGPNPETRFLPEQDWPHPLPGAEGS
ncbi:YqcI/YcgG family protein [Saccharopolyspora gregorii]|uniref:YqcI/YcgG family protein n=1 Tax=Saccharopolyspora gregorii TaxID=33914 RepID=UPI0021AD0618|nr:YqcI/YcgG family protein [Saccharopolyspora gregorii]